MQKRWLITTTAAALSLSALGAAAVVAASQSHLADQEGVTVGDGVLSTDESISAPPPVNWNEALLRALEGSAADAHDVTTDSPTAPENERRDGDREQSDGESRNFQLSPASPPPPISIDSPDSPESPDSPDSPD